MNGYVKTNLEKWQGRVDSKTDYKSFRWHQIIQKIDLSEDIKKATSLSFVLIGYKIDEGIRLNSGRIGAAKGPDIIREFLSNKPCSFSQNINIYDAGDIHLENTVEQAQDLLSKLVKKCLDNGYFPIVIGGGHDVALGTMKGVIDKYDVTKEKLGIINFDSHFDLRLNQQSTSGTMFRQAHDIVANKNATFNHLTIGIQKSGNTISLFEYAKSIKSKYILAGDIIHENMAINHYKLDEFVNPLDNLYISVCTDVFATPFAPGVSSPQPMGIIPDLFLDLLKQILDTHKVRAFDIAEISPPLDNGNATASLGALIIYTVINHLAEINE